MDFGIKCIFNSQRIESEKICSIKYSEATPDCRNAPLSLNTSASSSGGHSVDIGLDLEPLGNSSKICFLVNASITGVKAVMVEGTFDIGQCLYL